jgi:hypothetical protein
MKFNRTEGSFTFIPSGRHKNIISDFMTVELNTTIQKEIKA